MQAQILNLMRDLQQRMQLTYLFISHNLAVVRHMSDQLGVMYLGRIVEYGPGESIFTAPRHPYTRLLLDAIPDLAMTGRSAHAGGRRGAEPDRPAVGLHLPSALPVRQRALPGRAARLHARRRRAGGLPCGRGAADRAARGAARPADVSARPARGRAAQRLGVLAEEAASAALAAEGWTVLARRLRTPAGELDLVAERDGLLAFVEVKARPTLSGAAGALGPRQRARLLAAAEIALAEHPGWGAAGVRFDVLVVDVAGRVRRIEDAFRAGDGV